MSATALEALLEMNTVLRTVTPTKVVAFLSHTGWQREVSPDGIATVFSHPKSPITDLRITVPRVQDFRGIGATLGRLIANIVLVNNIAPLEALNSLSGTDFSEWVSEIYCEACNKKFYSTIATKSVCCMSCSGRRHYLAKCLDAKHNEGHKEYAILKCIECRKAYLADSVHSHFCGDRCSREYPKRHKKLEEAYFSKE